MLTESIALNAILCQKLPVQKFFGHTKLRMYRGLRLLEGDGVSRNEQVPDGALPRGSSLAEPPTSPTSTNPPLGDFSPSANSNTTESPAPDNDPATTPLHETPSPQIYFPDEEQLEGLCYFEKRLLTLLDHTAPGDKERRESLQETLAEVRHQKATIELRLSPKHPGAKITTNPPTHYSRPSFSPQPQNSAPSEPDLTDYPMTSDK